jgi:hypothetical protein
VFSLLPRNPSLCAKSPKRPGHVAQRRPG